MPNPRPDILVIMSDQHHAGFMGCAGHPVVRTANLDALAARGVRFTNAYCPNPLCVPSRMGFMTGRYPSEVDCWDNGSVLDPDAPTFAHALSDAGYATTLCGRMHFVGPDQHHGFQERILGEALGSLSPEIIGEGINRTNGQTRYAVEVSGHGNTAFRAYDHEVTSRARGFIGERFGQADPQCLVVGMMLPHNPLICRRDLFEYYMDRIETVQAVSEDYLVGLHPAMKLWRERRGVDDLTPEQRRRGRAAYCGLVTELDENIGRVLEALEAAASERGTVVVYCSDHGDMAGDHGMWWKSSFYEGSAGVPLLVAGPAPMRRGVRDETILNLIDIGPTLIEIAGGAPLPDASSRSFLDALQGGAVEDREVYSEFIGLWGGKPACMIRSGPWKLNYYSETDSYQLFNLAADPDEMNDLRDAPEYRELAEDLLAKVHARWSAENAFAGAERQRDLRQRLAAEGVDEPSRDVPPFVCPPDANAFDFGQIGGRPEGMTEPSDAP